MPVTPGQIDVVEVHHADGTTGTTRLQVIGVVKPPAPAPAPAPTSAPALAPAPAPAPVNQAPGTKN